MFNSGATTTAAFSFHFHATVFTAVPPDLNSGVLEHAWQQIT